MCMCTARGSSMTVRAKRTAWSLMSWLDRVSANHRALSRVGMSAGCQRQIEPHPYTDAYPGVPSSEIAFRFVRETYHINFLSADELWVCTFWPCHGIALSNDYIQNPMLLNGQLISLRPIDRLPTFLSQNLQEMPYNPHSHPLIPLQLNPQHALRGTSV
jgi:hypothetical protein